MTHIIFITEDRKEDWWRKKDKKIIGLHPELVEEILEAGASMFYMYTADNFLKYAHDHLKLEIEEKSIEQVEEISVSNSLLKSEISDNSSTPLRINLSQPLRFNVTQLDRIERLKAAFNNIHNIQALAGAVNNPFIDVAYFAKQLGINSEDLSDSNASQEADS